MCQERKREGTSDDREEATELVLKYGFVEVDGTVEVIENDYL